MVSSTASVELDASGLSARNALVEANLDWARRIAKSVFMRLRITSVDWADYVQAATIGLIEAAERYKPELGVPFRAYAIRRVRGEVFNSLRSITRTVGNGSGHDVLIERAEALDNADLDPVERIVELVTGLGAGILLEQESMPVDLVTPCTAYRAAEQVQMRQLLFAALQSLAERERMIVSMHYLHHVPFVDIARTMELTKGRISQLHSRAMKQLREAICRGGLIR